LKTTSTSFDSLVAGKQVFEHYLVGRFAVVFVKLSESGAVGRGVFFEPKPGKRRPIPFDEGVDRYLGLVGSRRDTIPFVAIMK
jgi:hypothetical protein